MGAVITIFHICCEPCAVKNYMYVIEISDKTLIYFFSYWEQSGKSLFSSNIMI